MKGLGVKQNVIYNLIYQILNVIIPLVTTPYLSRILEADNIGIYSYTNSFVTTFVMVGSLGIGTYGQREIAAANKDQIGRVFLEIQIVKSISIIIAYVLFIPFAFIDNNNTLYYMLQTPFFVAAILDISWLYQGLENFRIVALRNILIKIVSLIAIFVLVKNKEDLGIYIIILCCSQCVGNFTMWGGIPALLSGVRLHLNNCRRHIKPVFVYFIPTIAFQIYSVLDKAMLGLISKNNEENGYYEQAHKLINMVILFISSYTVVMRSRMTKLFAKGTKEEVINTFDKSLRNICFFIFPMAMGLAGLADNLVPWFFGEGYEKVKILLKIFSAFIVWKGIASCIGTHILTPSGLQGKSNIGQCLAAAINLILNAMLIPVFSSIGAAIASVLAELIVLISYLFFSKEYVSLKKIVQLSWKYIVGSTIMLILLLFIGQFFESTILNSFFLIGIGILTYFFMVILFHDKLIFELISKIAHSIKEKIRRK